MNINFDLVEKGIINQNVPIDSFKCINKDMEYYISHEAIKDQEKLIGKTWCWVLERKVLLGFITLAAYSINKKNILSDKRNKFPYSTIPSLLIGQLAAHKEYEHNGLGKMMLDYAVTVAYELTNRIGCRLIVLHPLPSAIPWYEKNTKFTMLSRDKGQNNIMYYDLGKKL